MLFTEIISLQHSHFIFASSAAKDYSNLLGRGIAGNSYSSDCLPGVFSSALSHCFLRCIPPSPRCDLQPLFQNIWLFLGPHWSSADVPPFASSTCLHNQPASIATSHQSRFHPVCKFHQLFTFLPFANKGLLLCGYWIILQLFALRIFLPPTFSQLTFHHPCVCSFR